MFNFTHRFTTRSAGMALGVLIGAALTLPTHAAEIWKINPEKSTLRSGSSTLVLERGTGKPATPGVEAKGNPASTFLVISNGKLYWATDESAYAANSGAGLRAVDYSKWRAMKFVEIGDKLRSADRCGFRCQAGLPDRRMTLTFTGKNMEAGRPMSNIVVFNE